MRSLPLLPPELSRWIRLKSRVHYFVSRLRLEEWLTLAFACIGIVAGAIGLWGSFSITQSLLGPSREVVVLDLGQVEDSKGDVQLKGFYKNSFEVLHAGEAFHSEDTIITRSASSVVLRFHDGSVVEVGPDSMVRLRFEPKYELGNTVRVPELDLVEGSINATASNTSRLQVVSDGVKQTVFSGKKQQIRQQTIREPVLPKYTPARTLANETPPPPSQDPVPYLIQGDLSAMVRVKTIQRSPTGERYVPVDVDLQLAESPAGTDHSSAITLPNEISASWNMKFVQENINNNFIFRRDGNSNHYRASLMSHHPGIANIRIPEMSLGPQSRLSASFLAVEIEREWQDDQLTIVQAPVPWALWTRVAPVSPEMLAFGPVFQWRIANQLNGEATGFDWQVGDRKFLNRSDQLELTLRELPLGRPEIAVILHDKNGFLLHSKTVPVRIHLPVFQAKFHVASDGRKNASGTPKTGVIVWPRLPIYRSYEWQYLNEVNRPVRSGKTSEHYITIGERDTQNEATGIDRPSRFIGTWEAGHQIQVRGIDARGEAGPWSRVR